MLLTPFKCKSRELSFAGCFLSSGTEMSAAFVLPRGSFTKPYTHKVYYCCHLLPNVSVIDPLVFLIHSFPLATVFQDKEWESSVQFLPASDNKKLEKKKGPRKIGAVIGVVIFALVVALMIGLLVWHFQCECHTSLSNQHSHQSVGKNRTEHNGHIGWKLKKRKLKTKSYLLLIVVYQQPLINGCWLFPKKERFIPSLCVGAGLQLCLCISAVRKDVRVKRIYTGSMRITNQVFENAYENSNSTEFKALAKQVVSQVRLLHWHRRYNTHTYTACIVCFC